MFFVRILMTVLTVVFWMIAGALALFVITLLMMLLPPAGPLLGPFGGLLLLLIIARAAKRLRRHRGTMVLFYLKQAVSLNLPIPIMLAAAQASESGALRRRLRDVRMSLENGRTVGESLHMHVPELPVRTLGLISAGDRIGRLSSTLKGLVAEERTVTQDESYGPLLGWNYGLVLVLFMMLLLSGIGYFIMPKFQDIFEDFDSVMPWQTMLTFDVIGNIGLPLLPLSLLVIVAVAGWAMYQALHGGNGRYRPFGPLTGRLIWITPIAGKSVRDRGLADACRLIAEALTAGDTIESAAFEAGDLNTNVILKYRLQRFADAVRIGLPLRDAAADAHLPKLMVGMLATGQAVADPVRVFDFLSRYYANRFSRLATLIRASVLPTVVLVLSVIVGWIVYSMMLPLVVLIEDQVIQVGAF